MFVLDSHITIGKYSFTAIHDGEITKSVEQISDTAVIKLPTRFKIRQSGDFVGAESVIKVGDAVAITLAYNGKYEGVEFVGYVTKLKPTIPLQIECEDAIWLLRRKTINKVWGETTLRELLEEVVKDTPLKLADNIPFIAINAWTTRNANGAQMLEAIRKELLMSVYLNDAGELYCGLEQLNNIGQSVHYDLNYNIVENNLEFKTAEDRRIKVQYEYINPESNARTTVEVGDTDGELRSFKTSVVSDKKQLVKMANAELARLKFDGMDGDITSFLIPFATRGMKAVVIDDEHPNRKGSYFIKKVVTTFGLSGARRKVSLGTKL